MRIFFSEYKTNYTTYTFSYAIYCIKDKQNELPEIYKLGFLPYTGNIFLKEDIFYLARSLRIDLNKFKETSENRRVYHKIEELKIKVIVTEKPSFNIEDTSFKSFCTFYAEKRFSGGNMDEKRLSYVLSRDTLTHIISFCSNDKTFGYVFAVIEDKMLHYWYAFFDVTYMKSHSIGKWMMWKMLQFAKENKLSYVYLGTCYQEKALYKIRDHKGVEFFDGVKWNEDVNLLKHLCKIDSEEYDRNYDMFKSKNSQELNVFSSLIK